MKYGDTLFAKISSYWTTHWIELDYTHCNECDIGLYLNNIFYNNNYDYNICYTLWKNCIENISRQFIYTQEYMEELLSKIKYTEIYDFVVANRNT